MKKLFLVGLLLSLAGCANGGDKLTTFEEDREEHKKRFEKTVATQAKRSAAVTRSQRSRAAAQRYRRPTARVNRTRSLRRR